MTLKLDEKTHLLKLLEQWSLNTVGGYDAMDAELFTLRSVIERSRQRAARAQPAAR